MSSFIGVYNKSVILTYVGIAISIFGIFNVQNLDIAIISLIIAGICDLFDGKIARMCKRTNQEKDFGVQIDSLADVVSFLILPSVLLINITEHSVISYVISVLYVLSGVTRLGWFNVTTLEGIQYYQGLPVTYVSLIIPIIHAIHNVVDIPYYNVILSIVYGIVALFFVLNVKIKKPTGVWYIIFSILAIIVIVSIIVW